MKNLFVFTLILSQSMIVLGQSISPAPGNSTVCPDQVNFKITHA